MYINSNNIVVYPTLKRNNNNIETSSIISEQGITSLINRLTENKSYVIDGLKYDGTTLSPGSCNICGYKFTIITNQTLTPLENSKYLYLKMNCAEEISKNNISPLSLKGFDLLTKEKEYNTNNLQYSGLDIIFTNSTLNDKNNAKYLLIAEKIENKWLDYTQFAPTKTNLIKTNLYGFDDGELWQGTSLTIEIQDDNKEINLNFTPLENCTVDFGDDTNILSVQTTDTSQKINHTYKNKGMYTIKITGKIKLEETILDNSDNSLLSIINLESVISLGDGVFSNGIGLTKTIIGTNVTNIGDNCFSSCSSLKSIQIPKNVLSIGNHAFAYCNNLTETIIQSNINSDCKIGNYTFYKCSSLTEITIPTNIKSIGENAFYGCNKLKNVTFADLSNWTVTKDSTTIELKESDLQDTTIAAEYLTTTYVDYEWTKKE